MIYKKEGKGGQRGMKFTLIYHDNGLRINVLGKEDS